MDSESARPVVEQENVTNPLYFRCRMCGECCSSWNIPIEGDKARALLARDWVRERLAEKRRELVKVTEALYRLPLTDENVCVFLAEDKRCMIETHDGLGLKPEECQRFPFAAVRMPDGPVIYDTSASCKIVAEEMLTAFQTILPLPGREPEVNEEPFPGKIPVGPFKTWTVPQYQAYQQALSAVFQDASLAPPEMLKQAQTLLAERPGGWKGFEFAGLWEKWVPVFFLRKPYGSLSWFSLVRGRSYDDPRVFGFPVPLNKPSRFTWDAEADRLIAAFLYNLLCRKVLLTHGHTLGGMLGMAGTAYFLVRWYAVTLAAIQDRTHVELPDLSMAIRLTERYYTGHQPRFLSFFGSRWRGWLVNRLLLG